MRFCTFAWTTAKLFVPEAPADSVMPLLTMVWVAPAALALIDAKLPLRSAPPLAPPCTVTFGAPVMDWLPLTASIRAKLPLAPVPPTTDTPPPAVKFRDCAAPKLCTRAKLEVPPPPCSVMDPPPPIVIDWLPAVEPVDVLWRSMAAFSTLLPPPPPCMAMPPAPTDTVWEPEFVPRKA